MKSPFITAIFLSSLVALTAQANDFPTQARVEYVLGCMNSRGGQNYSVMYPCICAIDKIASEFTYQQYEQAEVFSHLWSTAGERGGVFRDPDGARSAVDKLKAVVEKAEKSCFVQPTSKTAQAETKTDNKSAQQPINESE